MMVWKELLFVGFFSVGGIRTWRHEQILLKVVPGGKNKQKQETALTELRDSGTKQSIKTKYN